MRYIYLVAVLLVCSLTSESQSTKYWRKTIGYPGPHLWEQGQSIKQLSNGEYLIACNKGNSFAPSVAYMLKLDAFGNVISRTDFNDTINASVYYYMNLVDSGAIVAGWHRSFNPLIESPLIMKTDLNGDSVWTKVISSVSDKSICYYVKGTMDGGYIATGFRKGTVSSWDTYVVRLDSDGNILWDSVYVWPLLDSGYHIEEMSDGSFVFSGTENIVLGSGTGFLQKIDPNGNLLWHHTFQYPGDPITDFGSFKPTLDGCFIVTGSSGFASNLDNPILAKMDSAGNLIWMKKLSDIQGSNYLGASIRIIEMLDKSFIGCGTMYHTFNAPRMRMTLFKTDENGDLLWIRFFTQDPTHDFYGYDVDTTSDGGFVISGRRDSVNTSYAYVVKTNCLGFISRPVADFNVTWNGNTATFYNLSVRADTCKYYFGDGDSAIVLLTDTVPVVHTYSGPGPWNAYLVALACGESDTTFYSITTGTNDLSYLLENSLTVYPNPAVNHLMVELIWPEALKEATITIMDITSRVILEQPLTPHRRTHELDINHIPQGTYVLVLRGNDAKLVYRKIVVAK